MIVVNSRYIVCFVTNGCILDLPRVGPAVGVPRTPGRVQRHCGTLWACVPASGVADTAPGGRDRDNSAMCHHGKSVKTMDFHWFSLIHIDFHWFSLIFKDFH